jgi:aspartate ammonia-lyase
MNVNEVLARRAGELGSVEVSPLEHVNLHQSTNDTFPTALRLAAIIRGRELEAALLGLQEALQAKEAEFSDLVKMGRTQLRDAVLTTLGRSFGAWAEAFNRDRWRIERCEERLRVVNLGGTAIGTGLGAPRDYIFRVVDNLKRETGIGLARAENLVEATQNADAFSGSLGNACHLRHEHDQGGLRPEAPVVRPERV